MTEALSEVSGLFNQIVPCLYTAAGVALLSIFAASWFRECGHRSWK